jgi:hypothetical protein
MSSINEKAASTEDKTSLGAQSQLALDSVGAVFSDFQQQWAARFSLAGKEWQLTKQSASMVVIMCLMLAAILSTIWLLSNLAMGYMMFQAGLSVYGLCFCLVTLNIGLMIVLWLTIKKLCLNIGFSRCINSLTDGTKDEEQR